MADPILIARNKDTECHLLPALANRHGLITGATGTGKTITLQGLAEGLSNLGVPVFLADIKGDLTGLVAAQLDLERCRLHRVTPSAPILPTTQRHWRAGNAGPLHYLPPLLYEHQCVPYRR